MKASASSDIIFCRIGERHDVSMLTIGKGLRQQGCAARIPGLPPHLQTDQEWHSQYAKAKEPQGGARLTFLVCISGTIRSSPNVMPEICVELHVSNCFAREE